MKKKLQQKLIDVNAIIKELEKDQPDYFPILVEYKIETAKRELIVELLKELK